MYTNNEVKKEVIELNDVGLYVQDPCHPTCYMPYKEAPDKIKQEYNNYLKEEYDTKEYKIDFNKKISVCICKLYYERFYERIRCEKVLIDRLRNPELMQGIINSEVIIDE